MDGADTPRWLGDEPEVGALLGAVLDRFDQLAGSERTRAIVLPAQEYLHSLSRGDEQADQIWAFVSELARLGVLSVRAARRSPYDPEWHAARLAFPPASESLLRAWLGRPTTTSQSQLWREALHKHAGLFQSGVDALLTRRIVVPGRTAEEVVVALARLATVTGPATLRQLSAHAFWGDSKVLDERGDMIAALFPTLEVRERPIVIAVHLPERIEATLFIENHDTYVAAIEGEPRQATQHALVYMAGFRGAAQRIRSRYGACLHFAGPGVAEHGETFEQWWFDSAAEARGLYFWGDLDFAGMQILRALRQRFGAVDAWRPGYESMLRELLTAGQGSGAAGQRQVDPINTGCDFADTQLLPAIRSHGFWDQERIRQV